jgi:hypothetical protein
MVTVVVPEICNVVLPPAPNVAVPVPLLLITRLMVAAGFTVMWTLAVLPPTIGLGENESIVTVGVVLAPLLGVLPEVGQWIWGLLVWSKP